MKDRFVRPFSRFALAIAALLLCVAGSARAQGSGTVSGVVIDAASRAPLPLAQVQIVGTTRPRITAFMQRFRSLGLIETSGRTISVHRGRMTAFLARD